MFDTLAVSRLTVADLEGAVAKVGPALRDQQADRPDRQVCS